MPASLWDDLIENFVNLFRIGNIILPAVHLYAEYHKNVT